MKISQEEIDQITIDYLNGISPTGLSKKYKHVRTIITKVLRNNPAANYNPKSKYDGFILDTIREHYPTKGREFCAKLLNLSERIVREITYQYDIQTIPSFDPVNFLDINTPEAAYILGLMWADGHVYYNKKNNTNRVTISCIESDMKHVVETFNKTGKWGFRLIDNLPGNRKPQLAVIISLRSFSLFLIENDYKAKSSASACKILSLIPEHLHHYWFRGLIDGDGSFCIAKNKSPQITCSSNIKQDWKYFKTICNKLNIDYSIKNTTYINKTSGKPNSESKFVIRKQEQVVRFGEYLYQNRNDDKIGFPRKYEKFLEIKERFETRDERMKVVAKNTSDRMKIRQANLPEEEKQRLRNMNESRKLVFYITNIETLEVIRGKGVNPFAEKRGWDSSSLRLMLKGKCNMFKYKGFRVSTDEEIKLFLERDLQSPIH